MKKNSNKFISLKKFFPLFLIPIFLLFFTTVKPKETRIAHIYIDLASIPSLFQMIDAIKQESDEPKLLIWKRFPTLDPDDELLKSMNASMVNSKILGEYNYDKFVELVDTNLTEFYKQHPNHQFIIHLNAYHALKRSGHFMNIIPIEQIKSVHLYDDSFGRSLWDKVSWSTYQKISNKIDTYFHLSYYDEKVLPIEKGKVIPLDFFKTASELSATQKGKLAKLIGIDPNRIRPLFEHRPVAVFLDDPKLKGELTEEFIKKLISKNPEIQTYTWIYKNHPRVSFDGKSLKILNKYFKNVVTLSNFIPLESLILFDMPPDYIAGYGSSTFYTFKKEQILGYIERCEHEKYLSSLLKLGILTPELVLHQQ